MCVNASFKEPSWKHSNHVKSEVAKNVMLSHLLPVSFLRSVNSFIWGQERKNDIYKQETVNHYFEDEEQCARFRWHESRPKWSISYCIISKSKHADVPPAFELAILLDLELQNTFLVIPVEELVV